jgi:hypothetical protein
VCGSVGERDRALVCGSVGERDRALVCGSAGERDRPLVCGSVGERDRPLVCGSVGERDRPLVCGSVGERDRPLVCGSVGERDRALDTLPSARSTGLSRAALGDVLPGVGDTPRELPDMGDALPLPLALRCDVGDVVLRWSVGEVAFNLPAADRLRREDRASGVVSIASSPLLRLPPSTSCMCLCNKTTRTNRQ